MSNTLILAPGSGPPFTPNITTQRAVLYNLEDRGVGVPHQAMSTMFASLLDELADISILDHFAIGRILAMEVTHIETLEKQPPFPEELPWAGPAGQRRGE